MNALGRLLGGVRLAAGAAALLFAAPASAQVERVWLSHRSPEPDRVVVNWTSAAPGDSVVRFGTGQGEEQEVRIDGSRTLHHVEIPLADKDTTYRYSVRTGDQISPDATFKAYPTDELRVAVVADWQGKPDLSALIRDDPHLLLTAGDNVASIRGRCGAGNADCVTPYADLIDAYPELFRSVPFLPALGNHDKEVRPRGMKPPAGSVYDIEATAFRRFFELPGDEWRWRFDLPAFGVRFVALDLNHVSDFGTTWQSCHAFDRESEQFRWDREQMSGPDRPPLVVTLYNEKNSTVRGLAGGAWGEEVRKGTLAVSGFGYFAERAETDGFPCYNTSLSGKGDRYPDPQSKFLRSEDSYLLLTFRKGADQMTAELKSLKGDVLDRREWPARKD